MNSLYQDAFVMASIENRKVSLSGHLFVFPPQETMIEFPRSRFLEVRDADSLGIDPLENSIDDAVFSASVHGLQNN